MTKINSGSAGHFIHSNCIKTRFLKLPHLVRPHCHLPLLLLPNFDWEHYVITNIYQILPNIIYFYTTKIAISVHDGSYFDDFGKPKLPSRYMMVNFRPTDDCKYISLCINEICLAFKQPFSTFPRLVLSSQLWSPPMIYSIIHVNDPIQLVIIIYFLHCLRYQSLLSFITINLQGVSLLNLSNLKLMASII